MFSYPSFATQIFVGPKTVTAVVHLSLPTVVIDAVFVGSLQIAQSKAFELGSCRIVACTGFLFVFLVKVATKDCLDQMSFRSCLCHGFMSFEPDDRHAVDTC